MYSNDVFISILNALSHARHSMGNMYLMVTLVFIVLLGFVTADEGGKVFTNDWSVHIAGGVEHAKVVANDTGCVYGHEIIPGIYVVVAI